MSKSLIFPIATILIVSSTALGQTATGILQGRVADDSGAAVPDAKVTIENERTAVHQITLSNSLGVFVQPYLLPSTYKVTVEKVGFQKYSTTGVTVEVQKSTELGIILKVGEVTTTVEVSADRDFGVYADGEHLTDLPVTLRVLPRALRVIAPPPGTRP